MATLPSNLYIAAVHSGILPPRRWEPVTKWTPPAESTRFTLVIEVYNESDTARRAEYAECLRRNLDHPCIEQILVHGLPEVLANLPTHPKIERVPVEARCTFAYLFASASERAHGKMCIISNADIYFDETLALLPNTDYVVYCLTRWDTNSAGEKAIIVGPEGQDTWIFKSPLILPKADFFLGIPCCDNRLLWLILEAGRLPKNPAMTVRTHHLHTTQKRNYIWADGLRKGAMLKIEVEALIYEDALLQRSTWKPQTDAASAEAAATTRTGSTNTGARATRAGQVVPIIINNFNRLTPLQAMLAWIANVPEAEPIIIDNGSTYPPLLDFYAQRPCKIYRLPNLGCRAPWLSGIVRKLGYPYVVTDPDLDLSNVPHDVLTRLADGFDRHPWAIKVGLSLETADLPDTPLGQAAREIETGHWARRLDGGFFCAPVDTTFALYDGRPVGKGWETDNGLRTDRPYTARHLPWYLTPPLGEEDAFYFAATKETSRLPSAAVQFFKNGRGS